MIRAIERPRAMTAAVCFFFLLSVLFLMASAARLHAAPFVLVHEAGNARIAGIEFFRDNESIDSDMELVIEPLGAEGATAR